MTNISEMNVMNAIDQSKVAQTYRFALVKTMKEMMGVMCDVSGWRRTDGDWQRGYQPGYSTQNMTF